MTNLGWTQYGAVIGALIAGATIGIGFDRALVAQQSGITRTELTRVDVPASTTHEAVMAVAEIAPGASSGRHFHHGVEIGYVLSGSVVVEHPDGSTTTFAQGQAFRNPISEVHNAKNPGAAPVKILAVYIVEKGKPLAEAAPPK
ncbi:MAG TPA: cupin domain-containing protein [Vicinamibacterales bacterium]